MALSVFCYDRDFDDWGSFDPYNGHGDRFDFDDSELVDDFVVFDGEGYDYPDEHDAIFVDGFEDVAEQPDDVTCYRLECWQSEGGRGRHRSKGMTLRSWRNPKSLGGSLSRKAVVRKMDRRRPVRHAIWGDWLPEPSAVG